MKKLFFIILLFTIPYITFAQKRINYISTLSDNDTLHFVIKNNKVYVDGYYLKNYKYGKNASVGLPSVGGFYLANDCDCIFVWNGPVEFRYLNGDISHKQFRRFVISKIKAK